MWVCGYGAIQTVQANPLNALHTKRKIINPTRHGQRPGAEFGGATKPVYMHAASEDMHIIAVLAFACHCLR